MRSLAVDRAGPLALKDGVLRASRYWPVALVLAACAATLIALGAGGPVPVTTREIPITVQQYGYGPDRIVVNTGDRLVFRFASLDVVHGFYLEGHDLEAEIRPGRLSFLVRHPSHGEAFQEVEEVAVTAGAPGKYRYRCSVTCGTLHPFMQGELVVRPNLLYLAGMVGVCGVLLSAFAMMLVPPASGGRSSGRAGGEGWRVDLLAAFGWLDRLVKRRWFQFAVVLPNVVVLAFFIVAGLLGSPIGNRNIAVTVVWILWWFLLITVLVPVGGRVWCMACPLPFFGEWFARRRLIGVRRDPERGSRSLRTGGLERPWPRALRSMWPQNLLFLAMCTMSTILVTRPALTAFVLAGMIVAALLVHAIYRRRSFCRYLCPLNAWMSLYSMTAVTEVRPRDRSLCQTCRERSCVVGSESAWGCPWLINPSKLTRNNNCGLCMECVKACSNGNLTLRLRPLCSDTEIRRVDEAWMTFIMVALVIAYSVTLLGPWGTVKAWANVTEIGNWGGFALHSAAVWFSSLVAMPALWWTASAVGRPLAGSPGVALREVFVRTSYALIPLGLAAWAAFSIPLMMVNFSHVTSSLSDPLGWGWNLFGTAESGWRPLFPEWIPYLQVPILMVGLGVALSRGGLIARGLFRSRRAAAGGFLPHGVLCAAITVVLLRLFVG